MAFVSRDETVEERVLLPDEPPPLLDNELAGLAEVLDAPDDPLATGLDEDALLAVEVLVDEDDGLETVPVAFSEMVDPAEVLDAPDPPLDSLLAMLVS